MPKVIEFALWCIGIIAMIFTALLVVTPEIKQSMTQEHEYWRIIGLVIFGLLVAKSIISRVQK